MANYQLPNDVVRTFVGGLSSMSRAGSTVPNPGATFTAVAVPPMVNVLINGADVTVNAIGPNTVGIVVTFSEAGGLPEASVDWMLDTVTDVTPAVVAFNPLTATVTDAPQAVPSQTPATPPAGP